MNREDKLKDLKAKRQFKDVQILASGDYFQEIVNETTAAFEKIIKGGVDINEIDQVIQALLELVPLKEELQELRSAIKSIPEVPNEIKVASLSEFIKAIKEIKVEVPDVIVPEAKQQPDYSEAVKRLGEALSQMSVSLKALAPKPSSQKAIDFVPYRRVIKDGNTFKFDDTPNQGASPGGGGVPTIESDGFVAVPVANPDGTPLMGDGGEAVTMADGADETQGAIADAAVDTDTTGTISGKLRGLVKLTVNLLSRWPASLGQKTKDNSFPVVVASNQDALTVETELPAAAALADTVSSTTVTPTVGAFNIIASANGSQGDRMRAMGNGLDSAGVGIAAAGMVGQFDDTSPGTITENRFGNIRMSVRREVYTQIRDAAGNERGANVNSSNQMSVSMDNVAYNSGATSATTQRVVQANDAGKTIISKGGSASSSGDNTLVAAGTNKLKVFAFSLTTLSTTAVTCIFQSGASGTELWRVVLQAPTGVSTGANLSVSLPGYLFATAAATLLNLNLSSANAVHWSVSYIDEA